MSPLLQNNNLTFQEAEERLNARLTGLKIVALQNSVSDTLQLLFTTYSPKDDANLTFSIGTSNWTWKDEHNNEVPVFNHIKVDNNSFWTITNKLQVFLQSSPTITKVSLEKNDMLLRLTFSDNSYLIAEEDPSVENSSHYQLLLLESTKYQNYNLLIKKDSCKEEIVNGEEESNYKTALFDLEYFRMEHRNFTVHAIAQAREKTVPISFIQAQVLYRALTSFNELAFLPWKLRRSSNIPLRLNTIPSRELIAITRTECDKNNFTPEEAKDILDSTIPAMKQWLQSTKNADQIAVQEHGNESIYRNVIHWYETASELNKSEK